MTKKEKNINDYAYKLLKKKNYFIKEFYDKLINKYNVDSVNKVIKEFIILELLNDRYLSEMKICYFIHIKEYGKNYIYKYFETKHISYNLIKYLLCKYDNKVFEKNICSIKNTLLNKNKNKEYIYNYLLRKGYSEEEIKNL